MFKILIPAVAALGLTAFAAHTASFDFTGQPAAPAMGWHLSNEGPMAKLSYGVENSDQLALMMTCEPGDATAVVYGDVQPVGARLVQAAYAPGEIDPLSGGGLSEARVPLRSGGVTDLAQTGRMRISGDGGASTLRATNQERRIVGQFLAYCGSSHA